MRCIFHCKVASPLSGRRLHQTRHRKFRRPSWAAPENSEDAQEPPRVMASNIATFSKNSHESHNRHTSMFFDVTAPSMPRFYAFALSFFWASRFCTLDIWGISMPGICRILFHRIRRAPSGGAPSACPCSWTSDMKDRGKSYTSYRPRCCTGDASSRDTSSPYGNSPSTRCLPWPRSHRTSQG